MIARQRASTGGTEWRRRLARAHAQQEEPRSSDRGAVMVRGRVTGARSRGGWGLRMVELDSWRPFLSARWAAATVSAALHEHHVKAIAAGERADGRGRQPPLDPDGGSGRRAKKGLRPDIRGIARTDGRDLASMLERDHVRGGGAMDTHAEAAIGPGLDGHAEYLEKEASRGNEFLFVTGAAERVIDEALDEWAEVALQGRPPLRVLADEAEPIAGGDLR